MPAKRTAARRTCGTFQGAGTASQRFVRFLKDVFSGSAAVPALKRGGKIGHR
jgi:hypothetical protein